MASHRVSKVLGQKPRRAPTEPYKRPLPQQSSSSAREEDRRRRRVAFENLAKEMLRYLDNNDVKVGITELQERSEVPVQIGISIQQVVQQARSENGQKFFEVDWQDEEELCIASWARWEAQCKGFVDLARRCQDTSREMQMLNKRQEIFKNAIQGKLRVQSRASERLQDQLIEKKEMEHTKTEEALQLVRKEHDLWTYQNEKEETKKNAGCWETEEG